MTYNWVRATVDRVVCTAPGWIGCVILTPTSASKRADCTIYDGESSGDPEILSILGGSGETKVVRFQPPLKTQRGLYLDIGGDTQEVLIQHSWGKE